MELSFPLDKHASVFQAEVFAISACVSENLKRGYSNQHIQICTDNQATLHALKSPRITSQVVLECTNSLAALGQRNKVRLVWVPGHSGVAGNEEADVLVRKGSSDTLTGPEPAIGLPYSYPLGSIDNWTREKCQEDWSRGIGFNLNCASISIITGLLTGHGRLNKHLNTIGLSPDMSPSPTNTMNKGTKFGIPLNVEHWENNRTNTLSQMCYYWLMCFKILQCYKLDPAHYLTAPSLSWDAMLLYTQIELELLTDIDMLHFFRQEIRGEVSQCSKRKSVANNKFLPNYDPSEPESYIMAMKNYLPTDEFRWLEKYEIENFNYLNVKIIPRRDMCLKSIFSILKTYTMNMTNCL
ncbi:hypothetical protein NQ315_017452 [Exocentrus adspersus]|uniref:RNase H type-1 domain-containing protein n=1 Tax=Exocentrus adspersus TaxID=1586481 RepID=A0AAV8VLS4_9CUCU|nr:hypothetical protein NQ315_017452 [Exocentrus adspersus]